jgi:glycosyltransferase involved in cell wall biosynthesis
LHFHFTIAFALNGPIKWIKALAIKSLRQKPKDNFEKPYQPMYPTTSLIISTYNWPEALAACLRSVQIQKRLPDEIIIADDGSTEDTAQVIREYQRSFPIPIKHVWHPDEGFRLARIRNMAIAEARGEYIIQVDGDIIMHRYFILDHLRFAKKNSFVRASRIYLNQNVSQEFLSANRLSISPFHKGVTNFFSAWRIPMLWPLFTHRYKSRGDERWEIHGCNMAFWRSDAVSVNGYNENFKGWGPEDKEFVVRLLNYGVEKRFLKCGAIAFHIYHSVNSKPLLEMNEKVFKESIEEKRKYCNPGINQYLANV